MKREMTYREKKLKQINLHLDDIDNMVNEGVLTRKELTAIVLHRHILSMKQVLKYMQKNLNEPDTNPR